MADFIWQKGRASVDERIMRFMAGEDVILDRELFVYDLTASRAHAEGLVHIGVLTTDEGQQISNALESLRVAFLNGEFELTDRFEDGHSAIEAYLTDVLGDTGKKIHAGRSRNDQVLVATRLFLRDRLDALHHACWTCADTLLTRAEADPDTPMPGFTHLQHAVVSSTGHWFAGYAEAFIDNAALSADTRAWIDANPLGTAAGFGVNLPLDRTHTTKALGFSRTQINPMYAQNSRGKFELQTLNALGQALLDVRRIAWDLSLFCTPEFDYITLPDEHTTGSSIMPNKRNPDLIELLRASYGVVAGARNELESLLSLPAGYHRDLQFTKAPLLRALRHGLDAMALMPDVISGITFKAEHLRARIEPEMFATDLAVQHAAAGTPFRDAYRSALGAGDALADVTPEDSIAKRVSPGAPGQLQLDHLRQRLNAVRPNL
ncbi:MAG: argininosuccinate lyase [Pseudomonadota bacterium]